MRLVLAIAAGCAGIAAAVAAVPADPAAQPSARPQRIVSLNLCADQLVVELADPGQIAGLTRNADDIDMSAVAERARHLPILSESTEEILVSRPDLIVGLPGGRRRLGGALEETGLRTVELESAESYDAILASIRQVAAAVGHPERGEAMIRRMEGDLAQIGRTGGGEVAAYYQRRGYMTGTGTLIDDLMNRAGLVNLASRLDKPPLAQVSLEEIVAAKPDFLIVESATDRVTDQGTEMLHHPALHGIARISIPQAWTVCGGPAYVRAARSIAEQIAAHRRKAGSAGGGQG